MHAPPSRLGVKSFVRSAGLQTAAAAVVITLNVEPGGKVCSVATSPRGCEAVAVGLEIETSRRRSPRRRSR